MRYNFENASLEKDIELAEMKTTNTQNELAQYIKDFKKEKEQLQEDFRLEAEKAMEYEINHK